MNAFGLSCRRIFSIGFALCGLLTALPGHALEVGVNSHQSPQYLDKMAAMGAKWARIDSAWGNIQPTPTTWDFAALDAAIDHAEANGLQISLILSGTPAWASSNGLANGIPQKQAWIDFVTTTVQRYGSRIAMWAIWNEPNIHQFWVGTTDDYYNVLLQPAAAIIRSLQPTAKIGAPELALLYSADIPPQNFLKRLHDIGGDGSLDIITHHVYGSSLATFQKLVTGFKILGYVYKPGLRQIVSRSGFTGKPLWVTEFGFNALDSGEEAQASNLVGALTILGREPTIEKAFIYELIDNPTIVSTDQWGLLRADGTERPAFARVKAFLGARFE